MNIFVSSESHTLPGIVRGESNGVIFPAAVQAQVQPGGEDQDHREQLHGGGRPHSRGWGNGAITRDYYRPPLASHCHRSSRILDLSGAALRSNLDRVCSPADALIGSNQQGIISGCFYHFNFRAADWQNVPRCSPWESECPGALWWPGWSEAANLSTISGATRSMWPAGWSPPGRWARYRSVVSLSVSLSLSVSVCKLNHNDDQILEFLS